MVYSDSGDSFASQPPTQGFRVAARLVSVFVHVRHNRRVDALSGRTDVSCLLAGMLVDPFREVAPPRGYLSVGLILPNSLKNDNICRYSLPEQ